jgi:hypothetical protein
LEKQLTDIQTQWDEQLAGLNGQIDAINDARQKELDQVKALLSLCDDNEIIKPTLEPVPLPKEPIIP